MGNPDWDNNDEIESEDIEVKLLLEAVFLKYSFDFRHYSRSSVKRQILKMVKDENLTHISELEHKLIWDNVFFQKMLPRFSINVTEHFRDPHFYEAFRNEVVPILRTYPSVKIWHAGCATGQEVYSMAILLEEENLFDKAQIYATDMNVKALEIAKNGIYSIKDTIEGAKNYFQAGGKASFSDYFIAKDKSIIMDKKFKKNILFFDHNLATDDSFVQAQVILCRNVLIYFDETLTRRVVKLFYESLCDRGFLCLGSRERLSGNGYKNQFKALDIKEKIYQQIPSSSFNCVDN